MAAGTASTAQAAQASDSTVGSVTPKYSVELTDTTTGLQIPVTLDENDVKISVKETTPAASIYRSYYSLADATSRDYTGSIEVDLGDQIAEAFGLNKSTSHAASSVRGASNESGSSSKNSDVKVTAGLSHTINAGNNTVKVNQVFGSTANKGSDYVKRRDFFWRSPGNGNHQTYHPTATM
ncbi:hypothetical protein BPY_21930 [Bifidobacterium psychraerophilum]